MPNETWDILVRRSTHRIELEHDRWAGTRRITVDGVPVPLDPTTMRKAIDFGSVDRFEVDGTPCEVIVRPNNVGACDYDLVVNGRVHPTGAEPRYPKLDAHGPWWAGLIDTVPRAFAYVMFAMSLAWFAGAAVMTRSYLDRPAAPTVVPIAASANVDDDAWIELVGLSIDCAAPTFEYAETHYRYAGRDERGRPVVTSGPRDGCARDRARGEIGDARGTSASALAERFGAPTVRVLSTVSGPTNDRIGILVCSVLGVVAAILGAYAWVRRAR